MNDKMNPRYKFAKKNKNKKLKFKAFGFKQANVCTLYDAIQI